MKTKIIYALIFIGAFILTTAVIVFINSQYNNIFKFDFSPPIITPRQTTPLTVDTTNAFVNKGVDSNNVKVLPDTLLSEKADNSKKLEDSLSTLLRVIHEMKNKENKPEVQVVNSTSQVVPETEKPGYQDWVKKTSNLYASMDSKKAAKIIQNYADNIARDILYSMNKKKAAEILAEFKPEIATRIMSVN